MLRKLVLALIVVFVSLSATAWAHSPDPVKDTTGTVSIDPQTGNRTVTVSGHWVWAGNNGACDNKGVGNPPSGVAIDWNDPNQPGVFLATDTNGVAVYLGAASASALNPADNSIHPAACGTYDKSSDQVTGAWGPITHVYAASVTGPIAICPVTYHVKGGQPTAAGPNHDDDNSVEHNGTPLPLASGCFDTSFPSLSTQSSAAAQTGGAISDSAKLTGTDTSSPAGGTITWTLYRFDTGTAVSASSCTSSAQVSTPSPLTAPVHGDGTYTSPSFSPTQSGLYQWVATYGGDAHNFTTGAVGCGQAGEQTQWTAPAPGLTLV